MFYEKICLLSLNYQLPSLVWSTDEMVTVNNKAPESYKERFQIAPAKKLIFLIFVVLVQVIPRTFSITKLLIKNS